MLRSPRPSPFRFTRRSRRSGEPTQVLTEAARFSKRAASSFSAERRAAKDGGLGGRMPPSLKKLRPRTESGAARWTEIRLRLESIQHPRNREAHDEYHNSTSGASCKRESREKINDRHVLGYDCRSRASRRRDLHRQLYPVVEWNLVSKDRDPCLGQFARPEPPQARKRFHVRPVIACPSRDRAARIGSHRQSSAKQIGLTARNSSL